MRNHQHIAGTETGDKASQLFPIGLRTADLLLEDFGATGGLQLGNLRRQRLPICRYPPVTQMHHFPSLSHVIYAQNIPFEINVYRLHTLPCWPAGSAWKTSGPAILAVIKLTPSRCGSRGSIATDVKKLVGHRAAIVRVALGV
jgi:hypothetical protein